MIGALGGLMVLAATAAPPDDIGPYRHLATLQPASASATGLRPLEVTATGRSPTGGVLLAGDDFLVIQPDGRLSRDPFPALEQRFGAEGHLLWADDGLRWCDASQGVLFLPTDATTPSRVSTPAIGGPCRVYDDGRGGSLLVDAVTDYGLHLGPDGKVLSGLKLQPSSTQGRVHWCGLTRDRRALVTMGSPDRDFHVVGVPEPGADTITPLWKARWPPTTIELLGRLSAKAGPSACDQQRNLAAVALGPALVVLQDEYPLGLVATPHVKGLELEAVPAPWGDAPVVSVHFMEAGITLVVVPGDHTGLRIYRAGPKIMGGRELEAARSAHLRGAWLEALQAWAAHLRKHPDDVDAVVGRLETLASAAWWETIVAAPDTAHPRVAVLKARARAHLVLHWAAKVGRVAARRGEPVAEVVAAGFLAELEALATAAPEESAVWMAVAKTAELAARRDRAREALLQVEALGDRYWANRPELLALHVARGEPDRLEKSLTAADARDRGYWAAQLARLRGDPGGALAFLGSGDALRDQALRATLLADRGDLDEALAAWGALAYGPWADDHRAHGGLGRVYLHRGLVELAVKHLLRATELAPWDASHTANLALALVRADRVDDARVRLDAALLASPDDVLLRHQRDLLTVPARQANGVVVILPFTASGGSAHRLGMGDLVADRLTDAGFRKGPRVVQRGTVDGLLAARRLSRTDPVEDAVALEMCNEVAARHVITGSVAEFDGSMVVRARRLKCVTGLPAGEVEVRATLDAADIDRAMLELAEALK